MEQVQVEGEIEIEWYFCYLDEVIVVGYVVVDVCEFVEIDVVLLYVILLCIFFGQIVVCLLVGIDCYVLLVCVSGKCSVQVVCMLC